jgi:hypothetical protein
VPQSRERVFIIGAHESLGVDPGPLLERATQALPERSVDLIDILEPDNPRMKWYPSREAERHLGMMSTANFMKVETERLSNHLTVGAFYRRIRKLRDGTRIQRAEIRFDGLAGALRTSKGGSSVQFVLIVHGASAKMRALTAREYARLMGLPETYVLPANLGDARSLCGDGVVVPVARHIVRHVIERCSRRGCQWRRTDFPQHLESKMSPDETRESFLKAAAERCLEAIRAAKEAGLDPGGAAHGDQEGRTRLLAGSWRGRAQVSEGYREVLEKTRRQATILGGSSADRCRSHDGRINE